MVFKSHYWLLDSHSYIPTMTPWPLQNDTTACGHDDADSKYEWDAHCARGDFGTA